MKFVLKDREQAKFQNNSQLRKVRHPGGEIDYASDVEGRLTDVTGSSYGGITAHADSAEYRAANVLKHLES